MTTQEINVICKEFLRNYDSSTAIEDYYNALAEKRKFSCEEAKTLIDLFYDLCRIDSRVIKQAENIIELEATIGEA